MQKYDIFISRNVPEKADRVVLDLLKNLVRNAPDLGRQKEMIMSFYEAGLFKGGDVARLFAETELNGKEV